MFGTQRKNPMYPTVIERFPEKKDVKQIEISDEQIRVSINGYLNILKRIAMVAPLWLLAWLLKLQLELIVIYGVLYFMVQKLDGRHCITRWGCYCKTTMVVSGILLCSSISKNLEVYIFSFIVSISTVLIAARIQRLNQLSRLNAGIILLLTLLGLNLLKLSNDVVTMICLLILIYVAEIGINTLTSEMLSCARELIKPTKWCKKWANRSPLA